MALFFIFLHSLIISPSWSYYVSYNKLSWFNAETFCQSYCSSHLASIHDISDHNEIINLLENENVWIGLTDATASYSWTDSSAFDYGSNISGGVYPWNTDEPNPSISSGNNHIQMGCSLNNETCPFMSIDDSDNDIEEMFVCNDCPWNTLTKYVVANDRKSNQGGDGNANSQCKASFGTSLASIHSASDNEEAVFLCITGADMKNDDQCWIGLTDGIDEGIHTMSMYKHCVYIFNI